MGLEVDKWRQANTVKLVKDRVNRWIVARNIDDNPDENKLKTSLVAFFAKIFEREISDYASQVVGLSNVGPADDIRIIRASREPIYGFKDAKTLQTREKLPLGPLPFLRSGPVIYLEVVFNYRGVLEQVSWPVAKRGVSSLIGPESFTYCPLQADWLLLETAEATVEAPPKKSLGTVASEKAKEAAQAAFDAWTRYLLITGAALFGGLWLFSYLKTKPFEVRGGPWEYAKNQERIAKAVK